MLLVDFKYKLDCVAWGKEVNIAITGLRCCEICHTIIPEVGQKGHQVPAIGKRAYRQPKDLVKLVCCGVQVICIKSLTLKEESSKITSEFKYYCPKCKKGDNGIYSSYLQEIVCTTCKYHFKDMTQ